MSQQGFTAEQAVTAAEICSRFDLKRDLRLLLRDGMGLKEFLDILIAREQHRTAIDLMAHALSPRAAVWWGCLCLQHACGNGLSASDRAACRAAVTWVLQPTDAHRAAARAPAEAAGDTSPAGFLALAAHQAEAPPGPPDGRLLPPQSFAVARAVAKAVKIASAIGDPFKAADTQRLFVDLALDVATGRFAWLNTGDNRSAANILREDGLGA